ncbi:hypothetical protein IFR04_001685 [Cadophora malorum]|uniref:C2H2-type domain-containing protein n=1 Tax=Cadophora malorum TaxID=108018 RepID=A0A8H7WI52_9HELO|nr:hypothetical protein IFR04_001685 [Cadophora malorum]
MESAFSPRSCNGHTGKSTKTALQPFCGQYNQQYRSDFNIVQEEATTYPDTPPLTLNTRSTSSSIVICEGSGVCGGSSSQCNCLDKSDTESIRNPGSECDVSFSRSPITYPAYRLNSCFEARRRKTCSQSPELSIRGLTPGGTSLQADNIRPRSRLINDTALSPPSTEVGVDVMQDNSDFNESGSDEDEDDDNASDEDDSWSGQDSRVEAIILEAVGDDLELAAFLIPLMHRAYHLELNANVKQKVGPWCQELTKCSPGTDGLDGLGTDQTPSSTAQSNGLPPSSRKRQRTSGASRQSREADGDEDDEDEDEDDNQDSKDNGDHAGNGNVQPVRRLACPFHKREPGKYCIQHDSANNSNNNYRTCEGPGFKNIQRLKEHIKRKHYPVQCDRCYEIFPFPGSDRATGVRALECHRQLPQPCERRDSSGKEGISEAQCADLDKKKNPKKNQLTSSVEKYWEIWAILFPGIVRPASPWYDGSSSNRRAVRLPQQIRFCDTFNRMLTHQVNQQNIRFEPGLENEMRSRVENLVEKAFSVFIGLEGLPSSTSTSSSRSALQPTSLLSGSYDNISDPRRTNRWSSTPSRSSFGRSHGFTDVQGSPPANPNMAVATHHAALPTQYIHNNTMHMPSQTFGGPMNVASNLQPGIPAFQLGLHPNMPYPVNSFNNNNGNHGFNAGHPYMYDVAFANANSNFSSDNPTPSYSASNTQDLAEDWDQVQAQRRTDYNGSH